MNRREVLLAVAAGAFPARLSASADDAPAATPCETSGDIAELTLAEASKKILGGAITSRDLTLACLERTAAENPRVNAFITVMREQALAQAALLDAEAHQNKFRSPLHGIPIALKDAIDTAGTRTTAGSAIFENRVPAEDAHVVRRLRQAGAVILAKANLAEFSLTPTGVSSHFGPVRNPWVLDRVSGGSSSGSAAAVATRMCFAALGTDSGGSVRLPAAWCGLVGLKPTHGLVSNSGIIPSVAILDSCGPMARTVEDVGLVLRQMVGYDALDIRSVDRQAEDYALLARQSVHRLRVGVPRKGFFDDVEPQIARCVEEALAVIAKLTRGLNDVTLPPETESHDLIVNIAEICSYHQEMLSSRLIDTRQVRARSFNGARAILRIRLMARLRQSWRAIFRRARQSSASGATIDAAFSDFDVLVMPTMKGSPPTIEAALQFENSGKPEDPPLVSINNTLTFNRLGLPALTVPCGFSSKGWPIGLMIGGPRFSEGRLLALGAAYERSTEWRRRRPVRAT